MRMHACLARCMRHTPTVIHALRAKYVYECTCTCTCTCTYLHKVYVLAASTEVLLLPPCAVCLRLLVVAGSAAKTTRLFAVLLRLWVRKQVYVQQYARSSENTDWAVTCICICVCICIWAVVVRSRYVLGVLRGTGSPISRQFSSGTQACTKGEGLGLR